jgi:hypothetical protein
VQLQTLVKPISDRSANRCKDAPTIGLPTPDGARYYSHTSTPIPPKTVGPSTPHHTALVLQRLQYKYKISVTTSPKRRNGAWCPTM